MLKSYFKIAIAVLKRRKFFTFISLFGISITLAILMVITAFLDHMLAADYPDYKRDRTLYILGMKQKNSKMGYISNSPASFYFLNTYVKTLKTPEKVGISSMPSFTNTYINNKKLTLKIKYTNAEFWEILEFDFSQGKPFNDIQIQRGEYVAVITDETQKQYFGDETEVVGKYIETDNIRYRVIGVVKGIPITQFTSHADLYVPYTLPKSNYQNKEYRGNYMGIILARSRKDISKIKDEFAGMMKKVPVRSKEFDQLLCFPDLYLKIFTRQIFSDGEENSGIAGFYIAVFIFLVLFMSLPTINLVNINISRIMERSSEIGVRKAFGASSGKLVMQFIVENIILTLLGGIIGILLSLIIIYIVNTSGWLPNAHLTMNMNVLMISLIICLIFGFVSGVYPAWRMSRLHVVDALKAS
jgi:putative ABC transport system permease protein